MSSTGTELFHSGLIGPDGAGKTTAIRAMCGLVHVESGTVRILGKDPEPLLAQFEERYATAPINARRVFEAELATGMTGRAAFTSRPVPTHDAGAPTACSTTLRSPTRGSTSEAKRSIDARGKFVNIEDNDGLESLSGLEGLTSVSLEFEVQRNPQVGPASFQEKTAGGRDRRRRADRPPVVS